MTRPQIAEQILRRLQGGNLTKDTPWDLREIMADINQERDNRIKLDFLQNKAQDIREINGDYILPYKGVVIALDADLNQHYSILPKRVIKLDNDLGVYSIAPMTTPYITWARMANGHPSLIRGLPFANLEGRAGFEVRNTRVYYYGTLPATPTSVTVLMNLVVVSEALGDTEEFLAPPEVINEIIQAVFEKRSQRKMPDKVLDGVAT
ncbi:MAG: hypothetical protein ACRC78_21665 [Planktothrix sp.]